MKAILRNRNVHAALWVVFIIGLWELSSRLGIVSLYILPPFSQVVREGVIQLFCGTLGLQILNSMNVIICGFLVSILISVVVTIACIASRVMRSLFTTLCIIFNPLPGVALLPLVMMWFGIGNGALLALIAHGTVWPLVTNLLSGVESLPDIYENWADNINMTTFQKTKNVYIFSVMPNFLAGIRIGWGRAWRALISAEMIFGMIGNMGGIGYYIYTSRAYANMTNVMVGILVVVLIGIFVDKVVFDKIEEHTVKKWGMMSE